MRCMFLSLNAAGGESARRPLLGEGEGSCCARRGKAREISGPSSRTGSCQSGRPVAAGLLGSAPDKHSSDRLFASRSLVSLFHSFH